MTTGNPAYPVNIKGDLSSPPQRGWWLIKWLLAIPHYFILCCLFIAFFVVDVIAFFAILFTGKYPKGMFDFNVGVMRWAWRVAFYSYGALATDKYPPFSLDPDPNFPADIEIPYPEKVSKGLVLVKWWLLAIPHYIIVSIFTSGPAWQMKGWDWTANNRVYHMDSWQVSFGGLIFIVAIFAGICLLFTGKYPKDLFKLAMGFNRWAIRVAAYASLMTDAYPPFRLWDD
jgi:hypothetical protein